MTLTRRDFLKQGGLTFSFSVAGVQMLLTPSEAHAKSIQFSTLQAEEVSVLEAIAEYLVPGAKQAGVAHFVDYQLAVEPNDCLLVLKYFNYPPPYADFYRVVLKQLNQFSVSSYGRELTQLDPAQAKELIETIRDANPEGWAGPPAPLAYHVLRNDAVDVVYGTVEGFKNLGIPYMEHILPPEGWNNG